MIVTRELAHSSDPCFILGEDDQIVSQIWFKTAPVDQDFCYRAAQLQLITESRDQGFASDKTAGSWSWFELVILDDAEAITPRIKDGVELVWRSHCNNLALETPQTHFGNVFDRRQDLLNELEIGNVIAVRACVRFAAWENDATSGKLVAKVLDEDLFAPNPWSITPSEVDGIYTVTTDKSCKVAASDPMIASKIWFATPPLTQSIVDQLEEIQLFTNAHNQGYVEHPESGSWAWFDIVVLPSPNATIPKVKNGRSLEWKSHDTNVGQDEDATQVGVLFGREHELLSILEEDDVIAVRVCAQYAGWEHYAHNARLTLRSSLEGHSVPAAAPSTDWEKIAMENEELKAKLDSFLAKATPEDAPPAYSVEADLLTAPLRYDSSYGSGQPSLKLLSLDGGGVRGISALHILRTIESEMTKLTGNKNTKPCDYFDMIAGTSTGGLIAIMLGRLRMSVQECIAAYEDIAKKIFDVWKLKQTYNASGTGARFDGSKLENAIKDIVRERLGNENAKMLDKANKCKAFVLAVRANNITNMRPTHLRTYINPNVEESFADCAIWEAARATSAAPTYFPRIKIGKWEYVDGGLGFNNPVMMLLVESRLMFGHARPIDCLLTIGTGIAPNVDLGPEGTQVFSSLLAAKDIASSLISLATSSEHAHHLAKDLLDEHIYYRFNAGEKLDERLVKETTWGLQWPPKQTKEHLEPENWKDEIIGMNDWEKMGEYVEFTDKYLAAERKRVEQCAGLLIRS